MRILCCLLPLFLTTPLAAQVKDGNRFAYLDELSLYHPSHTFPKLITPQWIGDKETEAVVILAIDDMKEPKKYETYLRPILDRLKKIDGRAPVSIMTCAVKPDDPQLQSWLKEGLSIECHTFDHPCPFFKIGFKRAKETYDKCVDLMHEIPGNKPVAFRMPCCDSMNTPSPRFYAEIFNKVTEKKHALSIDTSVFQVFTSKDKELPKDLVLDEDGKERFLEYFPKDRSFVNWIENYPYPYMMGRLCWQFPCMTPSDWQAQHRHKPFNPKTVADWKAALDCTVIKKGVFSMVFHPHGWIKAEQVVEFIDHVVEKHGKKVKFLTFKEALERLEKNLLKVDAFRVAEDRFPVGKSTFIVGDHEPGVFILDVNDDGFMDVVNVHDATCRVWDGRRSSWKEMAFPGQETLKGWFAGYFFGRFQPTGLVTALDLRLPLNGGWDFHGDGWKENKAYFHTPRGMREAFSPKDLGCRVLDVDGDGLSEVVYYLRPDRGVFAWDRKAGWKLLAFSIPVDTLVADSRQGRSGLVFHDLNGDGKLDLLFSNEKEYAIYLFTDMKAGWSRKVLAGKRGDKNELPMISKNGTNNGFWIHSGHLWWSNEDTGLLKDFVDRRSIAELLKVSD